MDDDNFQFDNQLDRPRRPTQSFNGSINGGAICEEG